MKKKKKVNIEEKYEHLKIYALVITIFLVALLMALLALIHVYI